MDILEIDDNDLLLKKIEELENQINLLNKKL